MVSIRSKIISGIVSAILILAFAVIPIYRNNGALVARAGDPNNLMNDAAFVDTGSMSVGDIQTFLNARGGFLKDYSENGRSAAQIIYDASHGYGQASGSVNGISINTSTGTVSPRVILVTLQKEQGLLTMATQNDGSLRAAMGYGCPDSGGCNATYAGFTNQVEWGAWQFRYNYEAAFKDDAWRTQYYGSQSFAGKPGYVGQTVSIDNQNITFANAATASLYRYTPHIQSFSTLFNLYFVSYSHSFYNQDSVPSLANGDAGHFVVRVKNTGSATWQKGVVNLGTSHGKDRIPSFTREGGSPSGWLSPNRITMQESSVAPGGIATYSFYMRNDNMTPGVYREYFQAVADGTGWMEDYGIYWDVKVLSAVEAAALQYTHQYLGQDSHAVTLARGGAGHQFSLTVKNTGRQSWSQGSVNLGTDRGRDRIPSFLREGGTPSGWISPNRITMNQSTVAPGENATFTFWMQAPSTMTPGTTREYFRLVADGANLWMEDYGIYWDVTVP